MSDGFDPNQFDITKQTQPFDFGEEEVAGKEFIDALTTKVQGFETLPQISSRIEGQLGIPELRENVQRGTETQQDITSLLRALPEDVSARTRESLVTDAQRRRIIAAESDPLLKNLATAGEFTERAGARLSAADKELSKRLGLTFAEQERQLLPFESKFNLLVQLNARKFSGYTFENQQELDRLIANQSTGAGLTNAERTRLNTLAIAESEYRNALDQISLTSELGDPFRGQFDKIFGLFNAA